MWFMYDKLNAEQEIGQFLTSKVIVIEYKYGGLALLAQSFFGYTTYLDQKVEE